MNPEAAVGFVEGLTQKLMDLNLPKDRPVRLWVYDEMRYGLAPIVRRVWASRGQEVVVPVHKRYEWGYVFGALQVGGGGAEFFLSPCVNKDADRIFLEQISQRDPWATHVVIGDGAGFHNRDGAEPLPENVRMITLPPYSPELNPSERLWDIIKDGICNQVFGTMKEMQDAVIEELQKFYDDGRRVLELISKDGAGWLPGSLNAISRNAITRNYWINRIRLPDSGF